MYPGYTRACFASLSTQEVDFTVQRILVTISAVTLFSKVVILVFDLHG